MATTAKPTTRGALGMIFKDRQVLAMLLMGMASGLPYVVIAGTLSAWFTDSGLKMSTIGLMSWAALAYAFKFMWASALQSYKTPFKLNIGPRRFWMSLFLVLITIGLFSISMADLGTAEGIKRLALITVIIAALSASFDIVVAAWRIESARDEHQLDIFSAVEQFGYRTASFLGGAGALILADHIGWRLTFMASAGLMAFAGLGIVLAKPSPVSEQSAEKLGVRQGTNLTSLTRIGATLLILSAWSYSFYLLGSFMYGALGDPSKYVAKVFIKEQGPVIVGLTIVLLGLVSAWLVYLDKHINGNDEDRLKTAIFLPFGFAIGLAGMLLLMPPVINALVSALHIPYVHLPKFDFNMVDARTYASITGVLFWMTCATLWEREFAKSTKLVDYKVPFESVFTLLYKAIYEPMMELVGRLRWSIVLILALILTYRFTDAIWGTFAYPFYMGENFGALAHSKTEVGIASKMLGVAATIIGIGLGGLAMLKFGRMPVLVVGGILAAVTNLIFADLALGAQYMDGFLQFSQLNHLFDFFKQDVRMARLITAIFAENLAVGIASAASVAYLSSIVNKD